MTEDVLKPEDYDNYEHCELCLETATLHNPLFTFFFDLNPVNDKPENKCRLCRVCYSQFREANPEGISKAKTLFSFGINRGIYTHEQLTT